MAFPTVVDSANTNVSSGATAISMPASIVAGNLLLMFAGINIASGSPTISSGWTAVGNTSNGPNLSLHVWAKVAAGGDTATITVPSSSPGGVTTYQISGWDGVIADIGYAGAAVSAPVNPPALTMASTKDFLWFAAATQGGFSAPSAAPTNYTNLVNAGTSAGFLGTARRNLTASSDDPGAFSGGSGTAVGATVAVTPTAAGVSVRPVIVRQAVMRAAYY